MKKKFNMENNKLLSFLGLSIVSAFLVEIFLSKTINWPGIIGTGIGLFLWTLVITYLIKGVAFLFKSRFDDKRFYNVYLGLWILFLVSIISSTYTAESVGTTESSVPTRYVYSPSRCIYEVTFYEKPTLKQASIEYGNGFLNGEVGELYISEEKSLQKIEFYQLDKLIVNKMDKTVLLEFLRTYSKSNGLNNCDYIFEEIELGKKVKLRGYKTLIDKNGRDKEMTYEVLAYVKENNFLVLYAGCESKKYPTAEITNFLNSIRLKENDQ